MEQSADWERLWRDEPLDPGAPAAEARTLNGVLYAERGARVTLLDTLELPLRQTPGGTAFIGVPNRLAPVYRLWKGVLQRCSGWSLGTEEPFTAAELRRLARGGGEPLAPECGSLAASVVDHGANQLLHKLGRRPLPQLRVPGLDRLACELLLPVVKP